MNEQYEKLLDIINKTCSVSGYSWGIASIFKGWSEERGFSSGYDILGSISVFRAGKNCPINGGYKRKVLIICRQDTNGFILGDMIGNDTYSLFEVGENLFPGEKKISAKTIAGSFIENGVIYNTSGKPIFESTSKSGYVLPPGNPVVFNEGVSKKISGKYVSPYAGIKSCLLGICMTIDYLSSTTVYDDLFIVSAALNHNQMMGLNTCIEKIKPSVVISLSPIEAPNKSMLSKGIIIVNNPQINKKLLSLCIAVAYKNSIPIKVNVHEDNISKIPYLSGGVAHCDIRVPVYGLGTEEEVVSKKDIITAAKLMYNLSLEINKTDSFLPEVLTT